MSKFINPFTDIGFKRIFGQEFSKPLLLDFLNNLLKGERHITDLQLLDKEQAAEYDGDRSPVYDVHCETDTGEKIIVEMQNRSQPHFKERTLYYASEAIVRQGERGAQWDYDIKAVYLIAFTSFALDGQPAKFRVDVGMTDLESGELFNDKLRLVYLQLPLFVKEADDCENDFERWIYVLKNMETLNRLPWMAKSAVFRRLAEVAEVSALSKEERIKYDHALKVYRDSINAERYAEYKAEKAMQEGMEKGMDTANRENARKMKADNMPIELIAKYTGLTSEEINSL
jgi:predicted transposase/invertase (TIGR01784 family)